MTTTFRQPLAAPELQPTQPPALRRVVGDIGDPTLGPTLIVIGGLHGNEPAGVGALERLFERLEGDGCSLAGRLVGLTGNRRALSTGRRFVTDDLNRIWTQPRLESVRQTRAGLSDEDLELAELDSILVDLISAARKPAFVLDIHTTSGPGPAFSVLHDTLTNRRFARALPIPIALGLEEELNGTLTDHLTDLGVVALTVETGRHEDPLSVDRGVAALWIAMDVAGLLPPEYRPELQGARERLQREGQGLPAAVELRYRHHIAPQGDYQMAAGFRSFQPVEAGDVMGHEDGVPVATPCAGLLLMPLYQDLGEDGFFVSKPIRSMWLDLSTILRRARPERFLAWLPGIERVPGTADTFLVNRKIARWAALEFFHLLGYRRREHSPTHLVMQRRAEP